MITEARATAKAKAKVRVKAGAEPKPKQKVRDKLHQIMRCRWRVAVALQVLTRIDWCDKKKSVSLQGVSKMKKALVFSFAILLALASVTAVAQARELERKVPMLDDASGRAASVRAVGGVDGAFGVNQIPTDTFYYGGTVIVGGELYAAAPVAAGWANRKMWTWDASGFNGTPHSGRRMDGWSGWDNNTQMENYFYVADNATMGQACVIAGTKSLFCGATNAQCVDLCYVDQIGTGYGNAWSQTVVTKTYTYNAGDAIQLDYDYNNESEPGYDFTDVILQTYDTIAGEWVDYDTMAEYTDLVSGHETIDVDSYMASLTPPVDFRIRFTFSSDGGYSDEDGNFPTTCGGFLLDNYVLDINGTPDSEDFE